MVLGEQAQGCDRPPQRVRAQDDRCILDPGGHPVIVPPAPRGDRVPHRSCHAGAGGWETGATGAARLPENPNRVL